MPTQNAARHRYGALLLALPAVAGAVFVAWLEMGLLARSPTDAGGTGGLFFAAAVRADALDEAFAHLRAGADPNRPVPYRDPDLTADREVLLTPLLIAVANNRENMAMMLLSFGARMDAPGNLYAVCLARQLGYDGLAATLMRDGGPVAAAGACPPAAPSTSPRLLAFAAAAP